MSHLKYSGKAGSLLTVLNKFDTKLAKEMFKGGRFGKYGDAKRKVQTPKNWPKRRSHR